MSCRVFIAGIGIISPLGSGFAETEKAILTGKTGIKPLGLFHVPHSPLPAGEITMPVPGDVPRTHSLALIAAKEAMKNMPAAPDAVIIGSTTGGMPLTETLIKEKNYDPDLYNMHSTGSIAEYIAGAVQCTGPVLSVSTACSSGTLAIKLAMELIWSGMAKTVLAGGADALCRLTYHGFNSLQLIDPAGPHPFDKRRKGMAVAEGAAMLLLSGSDETPEGALAELLGAGLSCDAYHPASPHPEGTGAAAAMLSAIRDAGISPEDIDYINLHGTGTIDNDMAEAKALHSVFTGKMPHVSSTKGAFGHSLAAAGAIEVAVSVISMKNGIIPANSGCSEPDPDMNISPVLKPAKAEINTVLSNSFGFGGNNATVILSKPGRFAKDIKKHSPEPLYVLGKACATGSGNLKETIESIADNGKSSGLVDIEHIAGDLPKNRIRRLKRLPRMVLSLAAAAHLDSGQQQKPSSVFFGTGWGALTETYDFLEKLYESGEQFPSPTDFIGSVHNAPAGQAAIWFEAKGANITSTGGNYSFEQALLSASLLSRESEGPFMLIGADEYHNVLTGALDASAAGVPPSDGVGALLLGKNDPGSSSGRHALISLSFYEYAVNNKDIIKSLVEKLGGTDRINNSFGAVFAGIPAAERKSAGAQLNEFSSASVKIPVIDYRKFTGEFASASSAASVMAVHCVENGMIRQYGTPEMKLNNKGILVLGFGKFITAIEILR